jgi:threonine aldolase
MRKEKIYFAGEHNAGLHEKVLEAIIKVNKGKVASYREDQETQRMVDNFKLLFGRPVKVLLFNSGTAANIMAIAAMTKPFNSIVCPKSGHINTYETGAPTRFTGCTLDVLPTQNGKISPRQIEELLKKRPKENVYVQPKVVFITQPTELGTVWSIDEIKELSLFCKQNGLYLLMDGARIANAVDRLGVGIKEMTTEVGIDALTWGGIKNGGLVDALIFLNPDLTADADLIYKQTGQDVAKSRYYAATINALLTDNLWLQNARRANKMASRLYEKTKDNPRVKVVLPVETNIVWAVIPKNMDRKLSLDFCYYWETNDIENEQYKNYPFFARWVTSWATTEQEIDQFAEAINAT